MTTYSEKTNQADGIDSEAIRNGLTYLLIRTLQDRNLKDGAQKKGVGGAVVDGAWDAIMFGIYDSIYSGFIEGKTQIDVFGFKLPILTIRGSQFESDNHLLREAEYYAEKWIYVVLLGSLFGAVGLPGTKRMSNKESMRYAMAYGLRALGGVYNQEGFATYWKSGGANPKMDPAARFGYVGGGSAPAVASASAASASVDPMASGGT